jgi:tRNA pseudouridine55 synthase
MTSRRVVDVVQRLARPAKAGHAGTLDPLACGVLVVCVGAATRLIEFVQQMPKTYIGTFLLGRRSPTEDVEGQVTELDHPRVPTPKEIAAAAASLVGRIEQRPPVFSALKVGGRRAHALARMGRHVELKPRMVTVYRIDVREYDYPRLTLAVECSGGTYVRSLGRDLADSLGTAAVMSHLQRTRIGAFRIEDSLDPTELTRPNWPQWLLPPLHAVGAMPRVLLSAEEIGRIGHGLPIRKESPASGAERIAALDANGRLVAVLTPRDPGLLGPVRNLV